MSTQRQMEISSINSTSSRLLSCSSEELTREELIQKLKEYRKSNIELLEDKRHLMIRSQEAQKIEVELDKTKTEMYDLRNRINMLESSPKSTPEELASCTIKAIVRQLSNTSKQSEEQLSLIDFRELSSDKEEVFVTEKKEEHKQNRNLNLPLKEMDDSIPCSCGAADKLAEVVKVNHFWQKDYTALMDELNKQKARLWKTESELSLLRRENEELCEKVRKQNEEQTPHVNGTLKESDLFTLDDIEALKQQMIIYKEDYTAEKEDNKKITEEHNRLKLELQKAYGVIDNLTRKNNSMKESYRRVSSEKEHIIMELRRLSTSALPFSPVSTGERRLLSNESLYTLTAEDVIPHSSSNIYMPSPSNMRGNVVRDGRTSSPNGNKGRTSPTNQNQERISPTNKIQRRSSPTNHIDFKDLNSVDEDMNSL